MQAVLDHVAASGQLFPLANYFENINRPMGQGIGVAVIDSGINVNHPNFNWFGSTNSRVVYSESFVRAEIRWTTLAMARMSPVFWPAPDNFNGLPGSPNDDAQSFGG